MLLKKDVFLYLFIGKILICVGCENKSFSKDLWSKKTDPVFPPSYRKEVIDDLPRMYHFAGMNIKQVTNILGEPDFYRNRSIGYRIDVEYGNAIDLISRQDLIFYFSNDSTITRSDVVEWSK